MESRKEPEQAAPVCSAGDAHSNGAQLMCNLESRISGCLRDSLNTGGYLLAKFKYPVHRKTVHLQESISITKISLMSDLGHITRYITFVPSSKSTLQHVTLPTSVNVIDTARAIHTGCQIENK